MHLDFISPNTFTRQNCIISSGARCKSAHNITPDNAALFDYKATFYINLSRLTSNRASHIINGVGRFSSALRILLHLRRQGGVVQCSTWRPASERERNAASAQKKIKPGAPRTIYTPLSLCPSLSEFSTSGSCNAAYRSVRFFPQHFIRRNQYLLLKGIIFYRIYQHGAVRYLHASLCMCAPPLTIYLLRSAVKRQSLFLECALTLL